MSLQADLNHFLDLEDAADMACEKAKPMAEGAVADDPFVHWSQARLEEKLIDEAPPGMLLAAVAEAYGIDCEPENRAWAGNEARWIFHDFIEAQIESLAQLYIEHG